MPSNTKKPQKKCSYTPFREGKIKMFFHNNQRNKEIFLFPIWKDLLVKSLKDPRVQVNNLEQWMEKNPWIEAAAADCANAIEEEDDENWDNLRDVVDSPYYTIMDYNKNIDGSDSAMINISTFVEVESADHDHHEEHPNQDVTSSSNGGATRYKNEEVVIDDDDDNREDLNTETEDAIPSTSAANSDGKNRSHTNDIDEDDAAEIGAEDINMDDNTPDANGQEEEETDLKNIEDGLCSCTTLAQLCQNQNELRGCLPNVQSVFRALQRTRFKNIFGTESYNYKEPTPVVPIVIDDDEDSWE